MLKDWEGVVEDLRNLEEEAFDDEDSEKRLGKSLMLKLSRPEVEWGQPDHVSVWKLLITNLIFTIFVLV